MINSSFRSINHIKPTIVLTFKKKTVSLPPTGPSITRHLCPRSPSRERNPKDLQRGKSFRKMVAFCGEPWPSLAHNDQNKSFLVLPRKIHGKNHSRSQPKGQSLVGFGLPGFFFLKKKTETAHVDRFFKWLASKWNVKNSIWKNAFNI